MKVIGNVVAVIASAAIACVAIAAVARPAPEVKAPVPVPVHVAVDKPKARMKPRPASETAYYGRVFTRRPGVPELTALGARLFREPALSASGAMACATCHDPAHAFAPANDRAVQLGGVDGKQVGVRAVPTLRYLQTLPRFTEHFHDSDGDDGIDQGPAGGLDWDGRAATAHDQARAPLFSQFEMANASPEALIARLRANPVMAAALTQAFGVDVFATTDGALAAVTLALEVYQQDPAAFYPYTSKYDDVLRGKAVLSASEARGKAVFDDKARGNCASCHPDTIATGFPAFTDFGFAAIGTPATSATSNPTTTSPPDRGLCGPYRTDLAAKRAYCGMFRTPTLRNAAAKHRYFHDGALGSLTDVVAFYATRDVTPARWFGAGAPIDRTNWNTDPPFGAKTRRLTAADQRDVIAFLNTLVDADLVAR